MLRSSDSGNMLRSSDGGNMWRSSDSGNMWRSSDSGTMWRSSDSGTMWRSSDSGNMWRSSGNMLKVTGSLCSRGVLPVGDVCGHLVHRQAGGCAAGLPAHPAPCSAGGRGLGHRWVCVGVCVCVCVVVFPRWRL